MPLSTSIVGIITAAATVITALGGLLLALAVFLPQMRKTREIAEESRKGITQVHMIVNQQRTDMLRYQRALTDALRRAGVEVPADQSLDPADPDPTRQ
jgi:hypothetical protein